MPSPSLNLTSSATTIASHQLGFHRSLYSSATQKLFLFLPVVVPNFPKPNPRKLVSQNRKKPYPGKQGSITVKGKKENVWSVDNELASKSKERSTSRGRPRGRRVVRRRRSKNGRGVMVSGAMLMEVETVLQTQEPVIKPMWNTFASSVSGIWKGVGAVFSPITAEMEPVEIGSRNENLYDCYTLSRIESLPSSSTGKTSQIQRKINWVTLNPYGELLRHSGDSNRTKEERGDGHVSVSTEATIEETGRSIPKFGSFDFGKSDVMEEDIMGNEPGLVYFEDGSYSRGPVDIPIADVDESNHYLSPAFKFEQCLVKGCHKRLRIVHTIEFKNGGSDIQILRVAVYEEEWISPANIHDESDLEFNSVLFSQRNRTQPSQLTGSWKVFEVSATPVFGDESVTEENNGSPYVYLCTETLKKRSLPDSAIHFGEEEILDMQDVTMLWLPGGVTAYVDINKDGVLCIGVGWYSDEGINLVMERDYGVDGKLKEVRWKSELKRRWSDPLPV
ncbi:Calycin-like [Trema orientale]|uniref:Calycin-like n=1 Tax=Trema orientale TaxID=63057 RepID=A0A2P5FPM1_TREOI|nr:Calycin-like [Trema orientale]